jgi:hypothetical protein
MIERLADHADRAAALLTDIYRKPRLMALLRSYAAEVQRLEDAYWDLLTKRSVADATGKTLDLLGRIVGQPRQGRSDDVYRIWIAARVLVNASSGTRPQLLAIVRKLVGEGVALRFEDEYPAAFTIHVDEAIVGADGVEIAKMIAQARAGGVGGQLHWFDDDAHVFRFSSVADVPELDSAHGFDVSRLAAVSDGRDMDFEPAAGGGEGDEGDPMIVLML